ncbi:MAG: hypothetical protein A2V88_12145 [Elusimicrobia bacterium RBG_16_66_12]|nr:MAG: hypothetical protein A2V88_12145 [Elusimicrobia bacterium RBG_16_66_12]
MRHKRALAAALLLLWGQPAHALIFDTAMSGLQYAEQKAYQAFMKLKVIEQIRMMKQNYDASVRYYKEFERLNSGKGLLHNVGDMLKNTAELMGDELKSNVDRDFIHTYNTDTKVDRFFGSVDRSIANNMRYAGDGLADVISGRKVGIQIAKQANGLSPKDAANLSAKAAGLQIQMMTQLHEDNLRLIEISSMRLATEVRQQHGEQRLIESIRKSVEKRAPGALPRQTEQGGDK